MLEFRNSVGKIQKDHARRQYHLLAIICESSKAKQSSTFLFTLNRAGGNLDESLARRCFALFFPL
jgi:hypothetical protein